MKYLKILHQIQLWLVCGDFRSETQDQNSHERGILVLHTTYLLNTYMTQGLTCEVRIQVFIVFENEVYANNITLQISSAV